MRLLEVSGQRRFMAWLYEEPSNDPYVAITMDVNLEPALEFLDAFAREHDERAGVQHLVTAAVAHCLHQMPAANVKILGRSFYRLEHVHVAVPVRLSGESSTEDQTGMTILHDVERRSLLEIARGTRRAAADERSGAFDAFGSALGRRLIASAPRATERALQLAAVALRQPLAYRLLGPRAEVSTGVTNVGAVFGLPDGARFRSVALTMPTKLGHVATGFAIAPACDAPVAERGRVVVRRVLPVTMLVDHRAIDGYLMAKLGERLAAALLDPTRLAHPAAS